MEETLKCTSCNKKWTRIKTRGRKPVFCPKCIAKTTEPPKEIIQSLNKPSQIQEDKPQVADDKKLIQNVYKYFFPEVQDDQLNNQKSGSKWQCPSCKYTLTLYVAISDIPYHRCTPSSSTKRELKRIS